MTERADYFDTHAHIHFPDYGLDASAVWEESQAAGVGGMISVGCTVKDSRLAIEFSRKHKNSWAAVGVHPHEATEFLADPNAKIELEELLENAAEDKVVAVGEIGLDYYYENSNKADQIEMLEYQIGLAEKYGLPVIFHVRDAFADFWPIFDRFNVKKAVIHSFTGVQSDVGSALERDLSIGLNGIMTFTKHEDQLAAAKAIPLEKLVLETDAPFLTPKPLRGKICKPEHVKLTAAFLAELRGEPLEQLVKQTTLNARRLFNINN